jgi:hypothetical protein
VTYLTGRFDCPVDERRDLAWVAQYVAVTRGAGRLHDELHRLFDADSEPGPAHRLLARLPAFLRERQAPQLVVVTTNFDDALERAFLEAGESFDAVSYLSAGPSAGRFVHRTPDGKTTTIGKPNRYPGLDPDERTVILKVHGQVDRDVDRAWESFVVCEDDHIRTLAHADIGRLVPVTLAARLRRSHFLFLGQPPQEWSFRVLLHRVWGALELGYRSWAVEAEAQELSRQFWRHLDVDLLDVSLDRYLADLEARLAGVPAA